MVWKIWPFILLLCLIASLSTQSRLLIPLLVLQRLTQKKKNLTRFLANKNIDRKKVILPIIKEIIEKLNGEKIILMIDQTHISNGFECMMVSLRLNNRAIPVIWKVVKTEGCIGFEHQKEILDEIVCLFSDENRPMLIGDRAFGTKALVEWCHENKFDYMLRTKKNTLFMNDKGEINPEDAKKLGEKDILGTHLNGSKVIVNLGILHDPGYKEGWHIITNLDPKEANLRMYGKRWGIESMFSDFKSRGFCITKTHLIHEDRIERLILIAAFAMLWAVSAGMQTYEKVKKTRSQLSSFQAGLRVIKESIVNFFNIPDFLWPIKRGIQHGFS